MKSLLLLSFSILNVYAHALSRADQIAQNAGRAIHCISNGALQLSSYSSAFCCITISELHPASLASSVDGSSEHGSLSSLTVDSSRRIGLRASSADRSDRTVATVRSPVTPSIASSMIEHSIESVEQMYNIKHIKIIATNDYCDLLLEGSHNTTMTVELDRNNPSDYTKIQAVLEEFTRDLSSMATPIISILASKWDSMINIEITDTDSSADLNANPFLRLKCLILAINILRHQSDFADDNSLTMYKTLITKILTQLE